jgi:translation initiation factor IF-2
MEEQNRFRPPIVAIMGHVDHGKTTLLDYIRKSNVVGKEEGGITQHLGAYQVVTDNGKKITFLDTPGHAAFEHIRRRGGEVADIVVLVVAANDGVKTQTLEAIEHVRHSNATLIVAINKIDLDDADPEKVKAQLAENGVVVESYGGEVVSVEISAKKGTNVDQLLEMIQLVAEMRELKDERKEKAVVVCLESRIDKAGPVTAILVRKGSIKLGMPIRVGDLKGSVRSLVNDRGERMKEAVPSDPAEMLGVPQAVIPGALFVEENGVLVYTESVQELVVRDVEKMQDLNQSLLFGGAQTGPKYAVVIRADVSGSLEAILANMPLRESVQIIEASVGDVTEQDVERAMQLKGVIYAFKVKVSSRIKRYAEEQNVSVKEFGIIYKLLEEIELDVQNYQKKPEPELVTGKANVVRVFTGSNGVIIGGVRVVEGSLNVNSKVRILRNGEVVGEGSIITAKHLKDDVKKLDKGVEGGVVVKTKDGESFKFLESDVIEQVRIVVA